MGWGLGLGLEGHFWVGIYWSCDRMVISSGLLSCLICNLGDAAGCPGEEQSFVRVLIRRDVNKTEKYEKWAVGPMPTTFTVSPNNPNTQSPTLHHTSLLSLPFDHHNPITYFLLLPIIIILKAWPYFCNSKTTFSVHSVSYCVVLAKVLPNLM